MSRRTAAPRRLVRISSVRPAPSPLVASVLLLASVLTSGAPARADSKTGAWEKVREADGIVVHDRKVEGSSLREFRGRAVVDAPLAEILGVLDDVAHRTEWMHRCVGSAILERKTALDAVFYNRTGAPWPVADRDTVLESSTVFDVAAKEVRIDFHSVESAKMPSVPQVVRMPFLRGHWYLWPIDGGRRTSVEYQVHADPGGALPKWIANLVSKQIPFHTIEGMRKELRRHDYSNFDAVLRQLPDYRALMAAVAGPAAPAKAEAAR